MIEGESGILAKSHPHFRPRYEPSKRRLTWPDDEHGKGAIATCYSADKPDQLRGPQHDLVWGDEFAAWRYIDDTWSNADFGLRLGHNPQALLTTTPRPIRQVRDLLNDPSCAVTRGGTFENAQNLPAAAVASLLKKYDGTRLGRQELYGEILDDNPGALWRRGMIRFCPLSELPQLKRIVVAIDIAVTSNEDSDETGIIVVGLGVDGRGYVLEDCSGQYTPNAWAKAAFVAYDKFKADAIVIETNQGGDLVENTLRTERRLGWRAIRVHASRGKATRAEPVASLYEQGRVSHVGAFARLEDQMCEWNPIEDSYSPDRMDALVWGLTVLMVDNNPSYVQPKSGFTISDFESQGIG